MIGLFVESHAGSGCLGFVADAAFPVRVTVYTDRRLSDTTASIDLWRASGFRVCVMCMNDPFRKFWISKCEVAAQHADTDSLFIGNAADVIASSWRTEAFAINSIVHGD